MIMIKHIFNYRVSFIIVKIKAIRSITFMYIAVTRQDMETTAFVC